VPYINPLVRPRLEPNAVAKTPGELNYQITRCCLEYLAVCDIEYANYNSVVGVLECVKQELYRRIMVPYEEAKREINGEVKGYG